MKKKLCLLALAAGLVTGTADAAIAIQTSISGTVTAIGANYVDIDGRRITVDTTTLRSSGLKVGDQVSGVVPAEMAKAAAVSAGTSQGSVHQSTPKVMPRVELVKKISTK